MATNESFHISFQVKVRKSADLVIHAIIHAFGSAHPRVTNVLSQEKGLWVRVRIPIVPRPITLTVGTRRREEGASMSKLGYSNLCAHIIQNNAI